MFKATRRFMSDDVFVHAVKFPTTVAASASLKDAIDIMWKNKFDLPVVDHGKLRGLLHLHHAISRIIMNERYMDQKLYLRSYEIHQEDVAVSSHWRLWQSSLKLSQTLALSTSGFGDGRAPQMHSCT